MNILILIPRYISRPGDYYQVPLGLGYVASAMKAAGHRVESVNLNHGHGEVPDMVKEAVRQVKPDICASGSLAPFLSSLQTVFTATRQAKPDVINIAGGGMVSGEPEMSLDVMDIDIGVIGEGEQTIVELLACLETSGDLNRVDGIVFKDKNGSVVQTRPRPVQKDLSQVAWPDYELLECADNLANQRALDSYFLQTQPDNQPRVMDMITSRSCPFNCTFCFHPVGKVHRERPLDDFFAELDMVVKKYQINMVAVIDELFSLKKDRLLAFCERIKPYKLHWMTQLHVKIASEETLTAMYESGCTYISYGIESMSRPILESMQKKSTPDQIDKVLAMTYDQHIGIQGNLLFGDKAETLETANESMHWWAQNRHYQVNLTPLMVFPGSPDYYQALKEGLIKDRRAYVADIPPDFNMSRLNDKNLEMIRFMLWVFTHTLLNMAPLKRFERSDQPVSDRDETWDIEWDCPNCDHANAYLGVILPPENNRSLRLTCRNCRSRWDVENKTWQPPTDTIDEQACREYLEKAEQLLEKEDYQECHDVTNELMGKAPGFIPGRLLMGEFYRRVGPPEHMIKSFGAAVGQDPFNAERHNDFADALTDISAYGAARMHYQQALGLVPDNERARAGIDRIDSTEVTERQKTTYFISWADDPSPRQEIETDDGGQPPVSEKGSSFLTSVFSRLTRKKKNR